MKTLTASQLLEKLSAKLEAYEKGEATLDDINALTKISDSMCKVVRTSIEVRREQIRASTNEFPLVAFLDKPLKQLEDQTKDF